MNDESGLDPISFGNKDQIVSGPECEEDAGEIFDTEIVFWSMLVDYDSFTDQFCAYPLKMLSHLTVEPDQEK